MLFFILFYYFSLFVIFILILKLINFFLVLFVLPELFGDLGVYILEQGDRDIIIVFGALHEGIIKV